jgi:hypothetical protein
LSPQLLIREITATVQRTWNIVFIVSKYKNAAAKVRLLPDMAKLFFFFPQDAADSSSPTGMGEG